MTRDRSNCKLPGTVHRAGGCHRAECRAVGLCTFPTFNTTAAEGGYMAGSPEPDGYPAQTLERVRKEVQEAMRRFETGATRSSDAGRIDPEGFLNPLVIDRFCEYMNKHRVQADGSVRDSDNWQKGMPTASAIKGMWRHFLHLWTRYRGYVVTDPKAAADAEEDLCAILFNVQVYLLNLIKARLAAQSQDSQPQPPTPFGDAAAQSAWPTSAQPT